MTKCKNGCEGKAAFYKIHTSPFSSVWVCEECATEEEKRTNRLYVIPHLYNRERQAELDQRPPDYA